MELLCDSIVCFRVGKEENLHEFCLSFDNEESKLSDELPLFFRYGGALEISDDFWPCFSASEYFSDLSWDFVSLFCIKDAKGLFGSIDAGRSTDTDRFFWFSVLEQDRELDLGDEEFIRDRELHKRELGTVGKRFPLWPDFNRWELTAWTVGKLGEGLCFEVLEKCRHDSSLSGGFVSGVSSGVLTVDDTERELWSGFHSCVFETW